ncbi:hypothetical protein ELQ35_00225 [Peribacillus cavernae]|uniref:DUF3953 domain-containing protein n=1 Tax=Peribacillus cavernae TaxID=1674310 RepID=A0A433HWB3_9BACI|nr:hypothetical protein [Peribacillus cavernae]MDQ0217906.1 protein-S-isoprenylcysteine O-methyltransferase Ste14 [Peribacillus cavernae]RUQ32565.1 hypothetical protein ELQ35_00225 [Peribacillus cavernae]
MKRLSNLSIIFAVIGVLLFVFASFFPNSFEALIASGFGFLFIGLLLSFGAMFKREKGKTKFLSVVAFFLFSFIIAWNEPFQIVRLLTWLKN